MPNDEEKAAAALPDRPAPPGGWASRPRADEFEAAMTSGDLLKQLIALRGLLAYRVQISSSRDAAPIAKELREVLAKIDEFDPRKEENPLDVSRADVQRQWREAGLLGGVSGSEASDPPEGSAGR